ncbi:hypothetical protein Z517_00291 [Fonsecaea pedrosoi CBS 271.37]|uniref:Uncharacterized protein n=1 Tax=Fonsecaea pedrosoi CBS 271.37 TaxID=1442368 RepID=A0A0D2GV98_9EURO|nr:uncharacterized protein Z517_00291 [Fonsecaea pedrosoi CBS 271.37]KIW84903.1 hypothetical protein Z517_00291 [Fonsecaea pedrosoi CBS 271.37]
MATLLLLRSAVILHVYLTIENHSNTQEPTKNESGVSTTTQAGADARQASAIRGVQPLPGKEDSLYGCNL